MIRFHPSSFLYGISPTLHYTTNTQTYIVFADGFCYGLKEVLRVTIPHLCNLESDVKNKKQSLISSASVVFHYEIII